MAFVASKEKVRALLSCLEEHPGQLVSYERLCEIIEHGTSKSEVHVLRQYLASVRGLLAARKSPYTLAVAARLGYALCRLPARRKHRT